MQVWRNLEPPARAAPFTPLIVLGLCGAVVQAGLIDVACLLYVGFLGFLRTGELFSLTKDRIQVKRAQIVISLPETKTSRRSGIGESVCIRSSRASLLLLHVLSLKAAGDTISQLSACKLCQVLIELLDFMDLNFAKFNWYSLRRGGATTFFSESGPMEKTLGKGCGASTRSAKLYVSQALADAVST